LVALLQEPNPHYTIVPSSVPSQLPEINIERSVSASDTKFDDDDDDDDDAILSMLQSGNTASTSTTLPGLAQLPMSSDLPSSYLLATSDVIDKVLNSSPIGSTIYESAASSAAAVPSLQPSTAQHGNI